MSLFSASSIETTCTKLTLAKTLTNLLFLWLGFKGIRNCLIHGHDKIFVVSYLGYLIVGAGSTAFHATLKCQYLLVAGIIWHRPGLSHGGSSLTNLM